MEASGLIFDRIPCFSSSSISFRESKPYFPSFTAAFPCGRSSFRDNGHLQYYNPGFISCIADGENRSREKKGKMKLKKKKHFKMLKSLSRDLSTFSQLGFGLDLDPDRELLNQVQGRAMTEAAEILLQQMQKVKSEKDLKRQKQKEEKKRLKSEARTKKRLHAGELSSCSLSSESSDDSECGEVFDMKSLELNQAKSPHEPVVENAIFLPPTLAIPVLSNEENLKSMIENTSSICRDIFAEAKVEVCMGGKCKKSGGAALMGEFEKVLDVDGVVSGCKCMGKCRKGPNVRVMNSLCIGVGLEDVNTIVANFLGEDQSVQLRLSSAVC